MTALQWEGEEDMVGKMHFRMGMGFLRNDPPLLYLGPHDDAFCVYGSGGILGFADRCSGLAYGYTCTEGVSGMGVGARNQRLIDALYRCL